MRTLTTAAFPFERGGGYVAALSVEREIPSHVEGFWQRLPKAILTQALDEAGVPPLGVAVDRLKKHEAACMVAKALGGRGWLPEALRTMAADKAKAEV